MIWLTVTIHSANPTRAVTKTVGNRRLWHGMHHRDDYLDETFVYRTVPKRAFVLENWLDAQILQGQGAFFRHSIGTEYGLTNRLMLKRPRGLR